jgi:DNA-binding IclR family transcriptional regulator
MLFLLLMDSLSTTLKPLALLEFIAASAAPVALADVAAGVPAPRPTLYRWLSALTEAGLLQRTPDGRRYEVAPRATRLAFSILSSPPGAALRRDILQQVVRDVGESCNLTVLDGRAVVYIDRVETMWPLRVAFHRGSKVPVHGSASGKLFLALMGPKKREVFLRSSPLERFTPDTICEPSALRAELAVIRKQRYALDREEYLAGLVCLAAPIFQRLGRARACVAAIAIQAPVARLSRERILEKLPILQAAARALEATLG